MSTPMPSRRTVLRTTAWSVPAITVVSAAPAFATSPPGGAPTYQTVNRSFAFHPTFLGAPLTNIDILVDVEARIPLSASPGASLDPAETVSTVTIPGDLLEIIRGPLGNPAEIGGTSISTSTFAGVISGSSITNLTIDRAPFPAQGNIVTVARGAGAERLEVPADTDGGAVVVTLGPPNSTLVGYAANGSESGTYASVLAPKNGQDYTLGTFTIVA